MDALVFKKIDLIKRQNLQKVEEDILKTQNEFSARGNMHSSAFMNAAFKLLAASAENNIEMLLQTYEDVGVDTNEERFIVAREKEIREEIEKLAGSEGQRVTNKIDELAKVIQIKKPKEANYFWTNLLPCARDRAEILIETTKRRIANSQPKKSFTNDVFVIMQIGNSELDKIWKDVYVPVIEDFKLDPKRIDKHNDGKFMISGVAAYLNNSKLVIADLTNARPNCYLEVGYALGVEKNRHMILCAREDHHSDSPNFKQNGPRVHFDISGYDILWWDGAEIDDFKLKLAKKIAYRLTIIDK